MKADSERVLSPVTTLALFYFITMAINLNKLEDYPLATKELVLERFDSYQIFRYYLGDFEPGRAFISPLRRESKKSFNVYFNSDKNQLYYIDFTMDIHGDVFDFVMKKFSYNSIADAIAHVCLDFGIQDLKYKNKGSVEMTRSDHKILQATLPKKMSIKIPKKVLSITKREWNKSDAAYWYPFGISRDTLDFFRVVPIKHYFINNNVYGADNLSYAYREYKDGVLTIKVDQPHSVYRKWISGTQYDVWQGWSQLPREGDMVILTKSLKDVMSIREVTGIPAVSLQGETVNPKRNVIAELRKRFKHVIVFYDNDISKEKNWVQIAAKKLCDEFGLPSIVIPARHHCKDFSDLVRYIGRKEAKQILINQISSVK